MSQIKEPWYRTIGAAVSGMTTMVPREKYLRSVRAMNDARAFLDDEKATSQHLGELLQAEKALREEVQRAHLRAVETLNQVKVAMREVAVYEGLVDVSPVAKMVVDLVTDHEELEARIEAALVEAARWTDDHTGFDEVIRLLRGGKRVPDTVAEALGDD